MFQVFPFDALPIELASRITAFAAYPELLSDDFNCRRPCYTTAVSLASVSYLMYQLAMPHLISTVAVHNTEQLAQFLRTFREQKELHSRSSRLSLDYHSLVRIFWATGVWEPMVNDNNRVDYRTLYDIMSSTDCVGLSFHSLHLLYNALSSSYQDPSALQWRCHRLIVCGSHWRWTPLSSTPEGLAFLSQLTHLALWVPYHRQLEGDNIPGWVSGIPFSFMPSLLVLSFPLLTGGSGGIYDRTAVCAGTRDLFLEWSQIGDFLGQWLELPFDTMSVPVDANADLWNFGFMSRFIQRIWNALVDEM